MTDICGMIRYTYIRRDYLMLGVLFSKFVSTLHRDILELKLLLRE